MNSKHINFIIAGAEKQAATSIAQAYPEKQFLFLTDVDVIDGWDLANVTIEHCAPSNMTEKYDADLFHSPSGNTITCSFEPRIVRLCSRWAVTPFRLSESIATLPEALADFVLPVLDTPSVDWEKWQLKGNLFHKPDAPLIGNTGIDDPPEDVYGCEFQYQEHIQDVQGHYFITGWYGNPTQYSLGTFKTHRESFGREDLLVACETVSEPTLENRCLKLLEKINWNGFVTLNLLSTPEGFRVSSIRPYPKAVFGIMKQAGLSLLTPSGRSRFAEEGLKLLGEITYTSYEESKK
ncbi:MAG: hypothetical protein MI864_22555 [Pseudomonadales bacterium]|nr:hypothetical protein [Pseudomonadales bacterium]